MWVTKKQWDGTVVDVWTGEPIKGRAPTAEDPQDDRQRFERPRKITSFDNRPLKIEPLFDI